MSPSDRIGVLITTVPPQAKGGIVALHRALFENIANFQFDIIPFEFASPNPFSDRFTRRLFRTFWATQRFIVRLIRHPWIKIIHVNTSPDCRAILRDTLLILASKVLKRRVVFQIHGAFSDAALSPFINRIANICFHLSDRVLVFSTKDLCKVRQSVRKGKVSLLPNGVKVSDFLPKDSSIKAELSIQHGTKIVLFLSRLIKQKGGLEVIQSIPAVVREYENVTFVFAGDGPGRSEMEEISKKANLEKWVRFTGHLKYNDVLRILSSSDIFVLPTYFIEGAPMAILQALAAGLPIISTRAGAIPDIVTDGVHGYLIESHDPLQLKERILLLLKNDLVRRQIRSRNIEYAKKEYDIDVLSGNLGKIYSSLLHSQ